MALSRELVQAVRSRIAEHPEMPETLLAAELQARESDVITALPVNMRQRIRPADIGAVWERAARWNKVRIVSAITAKTARISAEAALPELESIGSAWLVSKPLDGVENIAVYLYDKEGNRLLSLYAGRDGRGRVCGADKADFEELRKQYGVIPKPKMRCKGCASCTCGATG